MSTRAIRTSESSVINVDHLFGDTARSLVRVSMTSRLRGCVSMAMSTVLYTTDVPPASLRLGDSLTADGYCASTVHAAITSLEFLSLRTPLCQCTVQYSVQCLYSTVLCITVQYRSKTWIGDELNNNQNTM